MREQGGALDKSVLKNLPYSNMVYPEGSWNRAKYVFWRLYTPLHPLVRDAAMGVGVLREKPPYDFLLGTIVPSLSVEEFVSLLTQRGFGNHFIASKEEGEVISLRYVENFAAQYHLRVFANREVRGHYEFTPECHPVSHMRKRGLEDRREFFLRVLGDSIVAA